MFNKHWRCSGGRKAATSLTNDTWSAIPSMEPERETVNMKNTCIEIHPNLICPHQKSKTYRCQKQRPPFSQRRAKYRAAAVKQASTRQLKRREKSWNRDFGHYQRRRKRRRKLEQRGHGGRGRTRQERNRKLPIPSLLLLAPSQTPAVTIQRY